MSNPSSSSFSGSSTSDCVWIGGEELEIVEQALLPQLEKTEEALDGLLKDAVSLDVALTVRRRGEWSREKMMTINRTMTNTTITLSPFCAFFFLFPPGRLRASLAGAAFARVLERFCEERQPRELAANSHPSSQPISLAIESDDNNNNNDDHRSAA